MRCVSSGYRLSYVLALSLAPSSEMAFTPSSRSFEISQHRLLIHWPESKPPIRNSRLSAIVNVLG